MAEKIPIKKEIVFSKLDTLTVLCKKEQELSEINRYESQLAQSKGFQPLDTYDIPMHGKFKTIQNKKGVK